MKNKKMGLVALLAGVALLFGAGTFALWGKSAPVTGGDIVAGNLDVAVAPMEFYDVSPDRSDATTDTGFGGILGHPMDPATWKAVPGDVVLGIFPIDGALLGDNMVAGLDVSLADGSPVVAGPGWSIEYAAADAAGTIISPFGASFAQVQFASADNSNNVAALPVMDNVINTPAAAEYKVAVRVTFDPALAGQDQVNATQAIAGLQVGLNQQRLPDAAGQGGYNP